MSSQNSFAMQAFTEIVWKRQSKKLLRRVSSLFCEYKTNKHQMRKSIRPLPLLGAMLCVLFIVNCSKKDPDTTTTPNPTPTKSSEAKLQSFEFKKIANSFLTQ